MSMETSTDQYYDEALEYTEVPLACVPERVQTPQERREYLVERVVREYTQCVECYEHDAKAWNRLSKWLYQLTQTQDELYGRVGTVR